MFKICETTHTIRNRCCGSGMIYSGSGYEFLEFFIYLLFHSIAGSGTNNSGSGTKFRICPDLDPQHCFFFKYKVSRDSFFRSSLVRWSGWSCWTSVATSPSVSAWCGRGGSTCATRRASGTGTTRSGTTSARARPGQHTHTPPPLGMMPLFYVGSGSDSIIRILLVIIS